MVIKIVSKVSFSLLFYLVMFTQDKIACINNVEENQYICN